MIWLIIIHIHKLLAQTMSLHWNILLGMGWITKVYEIHDAILNMMLYCSIVDSATHGVLSWPVTPQLCDNV